MEEIWFGIETKVRGLIKDVLEPTVRRVLENKEAVDRIYKTQEVISTRIDDLDSNISKYARKIAMIDDLSKKIMEYDSLIKIMDMRFNRDREEIKAEVSIFSSKIINFEECLNVFDHLKDSLRSDITNLAYSLNSVKLQTEEKFEYFKNEYHEKVVGIENQIIRHEVHLSQFEKDLKSMAREMGDCSTLIQNTTRTTEDLNKRAKEIRNSYKYLKKNTYDSIEKLRLLAIKTMNDAQLADRKILELINNDLPIRNRLMMSETLFSILTDPHQRSDLAKLEKSELELVNLSVINPDLRTLIIDTKAKVDEILLMPLPEKIDFSLERTPRRNNKKQRTVFVVKKETENEMPVRGPRKITEKLMPPIREHAEDEASPRESAEKTWNNGEEEISSYVSRQIRKSEVINLRDYEVIKDQLQIARFNSIIGNENVEIEECEADDSSFSSSYGPQINYQPIIDEVKAELMDRIDEIRMDYDSKISNSILDLKQTVIENHKFALEAVERSTVEGKKGIKELEIIINQALAECTSAITSRKRDQSDFNMEIKSLIARTEQVEISFRKVQDRVEEVYKNFSNIIECIRILNVLCKQDESDRESIALMGYKENKIKGVTKPIVAIDKQCLSCTGQASVVITAFKIACLAYTPSVVTYKENVYSRKELLEAQEIILKSFDSDKVAQVSLILDEVKGGRCKTASNIRFRPLSVPSSNFTLQTPRVDGSIEMEFPKLNRRNRNFLTTSLQQ